MKDLEILEEISRKLSAVIALSFSNDAGDLTTADRVKLLVRFGLSNQDIANIIGTTKGTVEVLKSRAAKAKKSQ